MKNSEYFFDLMRINMRHLIDAEKQADEFRSRDLLLREIHQQATNEELDELREANHA